MLTPTVIDARTAFLVLALLGLLQALGSWAALKFSVRQSTLTTAQRLWIAGSLAASAMAAVIGLRSSPAALGNMLLSHGFMVLWLLLSWTSLRLELHQPPRWWLLPVVMLGSLSLYAGLMSLVPEQRSHLYPVLMAMAGSTVAARSAWQLAQREASRGARLMALSFAMTVFMLLARGTAVMLSDGPSTSVSSGPSQLLMALGGISIFVLGHLGFLSLQFDRQVRARIDAEQRRARAEERHLQSQERERSLQLLIDERDLLIRRLQRMDAAQQMAVVAAALPHELRQPLAALRINLDLLIQDSQNELPEAGLELLTRLDRDIEVLTGMIDEHLSLLRQPTTELALETMNLVSVLRDTLDVVAARAQVCQVDLQFSGPEAVLVNSRPDTLRQVMVILLTNAMDALADLPAPRLMAVTVLASADDVQVLVRDNGLGIAEHVLPHLFKPFASDKAEGLGIGLALAWRLAQRCGAELGVQMLHPGEPRPGAVFTLQFKPAPVTHP